MQNKVEIPRKFFYCHGQWGDYKNTIALHGKKVLATEICTF